MKYGLFGKFVAQEGKQKELTTVLQNAAKVLADDKNCLQYEISLSGDQGVCVYEVWTSKNAHNTALQSKNIRELVEKAGPFILDILPHEELSIL